MGEGFGGRVGRREGMVGCGWFLFLSGIDAVVLYFVIVDGFVVYGILGMDIGVILY